MLNRKIRLHVIRYNSSDSVTQLTLDMQDLYNNDWFLFKTVSLGNGDCLFIFMNEEILHE